MEISLDTTSRKVWDALARDSAYQQNWSYGTACEALGSRVIRLEIRHRGEIIGLAQIIHRRLLGCLNALVCTRGPVWCGNPDPDQRIEALVALKKAIPLPRLRGFFTTPDASAAEEPVLRRARLSRVMTSYSTAILDLTPPEADLRAAQHQKWRNRLNTAERSGLQVGRADRHARLYHWLLEAEVAQQKKRRYSALSPALVPAWQSDGGGLRVLTASQRGEIVAAMLFLIHGARATYHIGWSNADGKRLNAHNLLLWRAVRKLKASGVAELDLGGLNTEDMAGIARFKLGSGAEVKTLCGTWFGR